MDQMLLRHREAEPASAGERGGGRTRLRFELDVDRDRAGRRRAALNPCEHEVRTVQWTVDGPDFQIRVHGVRRVRVAAVGEDQARSDDRDEHARGGQYDRHLAAARTRRRFGRLYRGVHRSLDNRAVCAEPATRSAGFRRPPAGITRP